MTDEEELQAVLATIPGRASHLPLRILIDDLTILIDGWRDVREPPDVTGRTHYLGAPTAGDIALIDDLITRLLRYRSTRAWYVETEDDAIERQAVEELRAMSRHRWNEKTALVQQVRADLLAGRMTRQAAIETIGLPAWTALCTTLSDAELRRVLSGDR